MARWQLQEAKARLHELVRSCQEQGPQEITVRGRPSAVLMSKRDYHRLQSQKPAFVDFLRRSPLAGVDLQIRRDPSRVRNVRL